MGWIKLDDAFPDHQKFLEAGPLAGYLGIAAIAWSNRNLTDGFIPRAQVRRLVDFEGFAHKMWMGELAGGGEDADALDLARELVDCGLWREVDGGWHIHDYHDWQRSSEQIIAARDDAKERQRRSRANRDESAARGSTPDTSQRDNVVTHNGVTALSQAGHAPEEVRGKKETTTATSSSGELDEARIARELFEYWQIRCQHPQAKATRDRLAKARARIREGYTQQQLRQAIDGAARAAFVNDAGKRFDDFELIMRNGAKVEGFIERGQATPLAADQNAALRAAFRPNGGAA